MMGLARSFSAASFSSPSARATSSPSSSMSNTLPWRTLATPAIPSALSAPSMAFPCGSSTPDFKVTVTRARKTPSPHGNALEGRKRPGAAWPPVTFLRARLNPGTVARMEQAKSGKPLPDYRPRRPNRVTRDSALDQDRPGALRALVLAHDAQPLGHFGVGLEQSAEVATEAVLVELLVRLDVPQPAGIRRDLVGDDDAHHLVFPQPAAFHLEIDEPYADTEEEPGQEIVDPDGERHDVVDLLGCRPAERGDVLLRYHRIAERVVLVVELDDRPRQLGTFLDPEPLAQRACRDVSHHHFQRDDLHLPDQLLAHIEPADEMGRHADVVEVLEQVLRDAVVEHALAFDHLMLFRIEGGRIVLEMLDQRSRLGALIEDLRLAFIDAAAAAHRDVPWLEEVHSCRGSSEATRSAAEGPGGTTQELPARPLGQPSR